MAIAMDSFLMKPLAFEVTVTEQLLRTAFPFIREALLKARQRRSDDHFSKKSWIILGLGGLMLVWSSWGLLIIALMMIWGAGDSRWAYFGCGIVFALGFAIGICSVFYFSRPREHYPFVGRGLQNWVTKVSVNRLIKKAPYVVQYRIEEHLVQATISDMNIDRQISWEAVTLVYVCDYFFALYTGRYAAPLGWIYVNTPEQHEEVSAELRPELEVIQLKPAD